MANLGITLPIQRGNSGYFSQGRDLTTQLKSNLTNLILTRKGERIFLPDFGCDIHKYIFEPNTDNTIAEIQNSINSAIEKWMPFISTNDIQIQKNIDKNSIYVTILFKLNNAPNITSSITVVF